MWLGASPVHAYVLALSLAWAEANLETYLDDRWRQVAFSCRYGKAGLSSALAADGDSLRRFCNAVAGLMEDEVRASRR